MFITKTLTTKEFFALFNDFDVSTLCTCDWSKQKYRIHITLPPINDAQNVFSLVISSEKSNVFNLPDSFATESVSNKLNPQPLTAIYIIKITEPITTTICILSVQITAFIPPINVYNKAVITTNGTKT